MQDTFITTGTEKGDRPGRATAILLGLAALPILIGVQLILAFLSYDMASTPRVTLHRRL